MTTPRTDAVQCLSPAGLHRVAWTEWGDPGNPDVLFCVHGLTRIGRDFDDLAQAMADRYRVVCPDVVGRGASGWLRDPAHYQIPQYVADMVTLIARINAKRLHWVGTSMGGLIGMGIAAMPDNPIERLVLNDVGPVISGAALKRIGEYVGAPISFATLDEGIAYIRTVSAPFGPHSDAQWAKLAGDVMRQRDDGRWGLHYDPAIGLPFKAMYAADAAEVPDTILWPMYDAIRCPTLVIRGAQSDLLSAENFQAMGQRGPKAQLAEIAGVGHAPTLVQPDQIALVRQFLLA